MSLCPPCPTRCLCPVLLGPPLAKRMQPQREGRRTGGGRQGGMRRWRCFSRRVSAACFVLSAAVALLESVCAPGSVPSRAHFRNFSHLGWWGDEAAPPPPPPPSDLSPVDPTVSCEVQGSHVSWVPAVASPLQTPSFMAHERLGPSPQQCCRDVCTALCGFSGGPHSPGGHPWMPG